jgi:hypothetical protein
VSIKLSPHLWRPRTGLEYGNFQATLRFPP